MHEVEEEGKGKFYGTVKSKNTKIKSKIFLIQGGNLIKEITVYGEYEFLDLSAGNYELISKPTNKRYSEIRKMEILRSKEAKEVNFDHPNEDPGPGPSKFKWNHYLLPIVSFLQNEVIERLEDNSGSAAENLKKAKHYWGKSKVKLTKAIKLAEKYFTKMENKRQLTPEIKAEIDQLIKQLTQTRAWMDSKSDRIFNFADKNKTAKQIRDNLIRILGAFEEKTGKLVKEITKLPLKP